MKNKVLSILAIFITFITLSCKTDLIEKETTPQNKGLISIAREENGYRNYSHEDIETLKQIKLFRSVGVSIADIKLYLFGVMSLDEMMDKRKFEILKESGTNSEN